MKYLELYEEFEGRNIYNIERRNRFNVEKNSQYEGGWNVTYSSKYGKGRCLIFDKSYSLKNAPELNDDEMYLFGITTSPSNAGVGRLFLKDLFDYFNINRIYLPSSNDHPVWNKIANKIGPSGGYILYTLDRDQLFESKVFESGILKVPTIKLAEHINKDLDGLAYICLSDGYKQVRVSDEMEAYDMLKDYYSDEWEELFINVCDENFGVWFDFEFNNFTPEKIKKECNEILDYEPIRPDEEIDDVQELGCQIATEVLISLENLV